MASPKHNFLKLSRGNEDGIIHLDRTAYKPTEIGKRLHSSLKRKRLNVGGLGSGKTRSMCEHINQMLLSYPGGKGILARKDLGDLKKSAQAEFLDVVAIPETIDRFNVNDNTLYYKNGSQLFFMETKTPSNFKSIEIIVYGIEEADENPEGEGKDRLMTMLDGRLRQKIYIDGRIVPVPYTGIWTYNPTTDDHWLAKMEDTPDANTEVFRSSTYDNAANLPADYIPTLLGSLAPWEINSLIYGNRSARPKGKPVYHNFSIETNVRPLRLFHHLPVYRSFDFGFNHPCVGLYQYDPEYKRLMKFKEIMGTKEQLQVFAPKVIVETNRFIGHGFTIFNVCDPHGADQRDVGESSVEYLRIHHGIHCQFKRQKIKSGLDEIQEMILTKAQFKDPDWGPGMPTREESRFLVHPDCKLTIAAYLGGYYRDDEGKPVKDDLHDHVADNDRYVAVHSMGLGLIRSRGKNRYIPTDRITGYRALRALKK